MKPTESGSSAPAKTDELDRLVEAASRDGTADAYAGKRCGTRFAAAMFLEVGTDPDDPSTQWSVQMHNVSAEGFSFWSKRPLSYNSGVYVREFSGDNPRPWLAGRVTHCTVGIRGYLIGARFDGAL